MNIYSLTRRSSASSRLVVAGKITKSYCLSKGVGSNKLLGGDPPSSRLLVARKIPKSFCVSKGGVGSYTSSSFFRQPVSVSVTPRHSVDSHHRHQHLLTASHCIPLSGLPETCHKLSTTPLIPHRCYRHFSVGQCHHQPQYHLLSTILVEVYSSRWSFLPTIVVVAIVGAPPVAIAPLVHMNPQAYLCMVVSACQASCNLPVSWPCFVVLFESTCSRPSDLSQKTF